MYKEKSTLKKHIKIVVSSILLCGLLAGCSTRTTRHNDLSEVIEAVGVEELLALDLHLIEKTARYYPNTAFYAAYLSEKRLESMDVDGEQSETIGEMIFRLYRAALADEVVRDGAAEKLLPLTLASRKNALELRDIKPATAALRTLKAAAYFTVDYYADVVMLYENPLFSEIAEPRSSWD